MAPRDFEGALIGAPKGARTSRVYEAWAALAELKKGVSQLQSFANYVENGNEEPKTSDQADLAVQSLATLLTALPDILRSERERIDKTVAHLKDMIL